jgi:hypothetical protein
LSAGNIGSSLHNQLLVFPIVICPLRPLVQTDGSTNETFLYREKSQQQMALVKNINPAIPDQLQIHLKQRMTQLNNELTRCFATCVMLLTFSFSTGI